MSTTTECCIEMCKFEEGQFSKSKCCICPCWCASGYGNECDIMCFSSFFARHTVGKKSNVNTKERCTLCFMCWCFGCLTFSLIDIIIWLVLFLVLNILLILLVILAVVCFPITIFLIFYFGEGTSGSTSCDSAGAIWAPSFSVMHCGGCDCSAF